MNLESDVTELKFISDSYAGRLNFLGIKTLKDLLTYFPRKYIDSSDISKISDIVFEDTYTIKVEIEKVTSVSLRGRRSLQNIKVFDETGALTAQFFNQPYLKKALIIGKEYLLNGKSRIKGNKITFYPNSFEEVKEAKESIHLGRITPEYRLTEGISKKWLRNRIKDLLDQIDNNKIEVPNEESLITSESLKNYLKEIHFPSSEKTAKKAHEALSLLEMTNIHLRVKKTLIKKKNNGFTPKDLEKSKNEFLKTIPFELTKDQKLTLEKIMKHLKNKKLIDFLIQGDVGSGKTIIAFVLAYIFAKEGRQVALLAPTTVLARQHFNNAVKTFKFNKDIDLSLISSENKNTERANILIGTTAMLHRKNKLIDNLDLLIVDEQHRFGVVQRQELLGENNESTHFINMTATPIPRTIAELFFKDVAISTIKSKPKNRKIIKSFLVPDKKRQDGLAWIQEKVLKDKDQVYWVCPLIEDGDKGQIKSVEAVGKELKKSMPKIRTKILHGKMKSIEKQEIMKQFQNKEVEVLISTTVIEVGVDVANATVMVIENAERFGLAQLHQIRGRVGRGDKQSYCFMFTDPEVNPEAKERLEFFVNTNDGLEIAEYDLSRRGPGEVYGNKQSGLPELKIANMMDLSLIKKSKKIAEKAYNSGTRSIYLFE